MAVQRVLSGIVLFLMAAAGAVLLRPDLFPDIHLPAFLLANPGTRTMLGGVLAAVAALILVGVAVAGERARRAPAPRYAAGPDLGWDNTPASFAPAEPEPVAAAIEQAAEPAGEAEPSERRWAPLPPLRLVEPGDEAPAAPADPANEQPVTAEADPETPAVIEAEFEPTPAEAPPIITPPPTTWTSLTAPQTAPAEEPAAEEDGGDPVAAARARLAADPEDQHAKAALAEALAQEAAREEADGRLEGALQAHEESLSLYRAAAAAEPEAADTAFGLVKALGRLADCREARGHTSRARDLYEEAAQIAERLTWLKPDSDDFKEALFHARMRRQELQDELSPADMPA